MGLWCSSRQSCGLHALAFPALELMHSCVILHMPSCLVASAITLTYNEFSVSTDVIALSPRKH